MLGIDYGVKIKNSMNILRCVTMGGIEEFLLGNQDNSWMGV